MLAVIRAISRQIIYDFEPYWHLSARLRLAVNQRRLADPPSPAKMYLESIGVDLGQHADGALMQMDPVGGGALIFLQTWETRRTLTPEIARQLLEEGRTREVLSGFRSKNGKPFRARLVLNGDGKTEFEFPARTQAVQPTAAE